MEKHGRRADRPTFPLCLLVPAPPSQGPWARVLAAHAMRPNSAFSRLPDAQKLLRGDSFASRAPLPPLGVRPLSAATGSAQQSSAEPPSPAFAQPFPSPFLSRSSSATAISADAAHPAAPASPTHSNAGADFPAAAAVPFGSLNLGSRPRSTLRHPQDLAGLAAVANGGPGAPAGDSSGALPGVIPTPSRRASGLRPSGAAPPGQPQAPARAASRLSAVSGAAPSERSDGSPPRRLDDLGRSRAALAELLQHARRFESALLPQEPPPQRRVTAGRLGSVRCACCAPPGDSYFPGRCGGDAKRRGSAASRPLRDATSEGRRKHAGIRKEDRLNPSFPKRNTPAGQCRRPRPRQWQRLLQPRPTPRRGFLTRTACR